MSMSLKSRAVDYLFGDWWVLRREEGLSGNMSGCFVKPLGRGDVSTTLTDMNLFQHWSFQKTSIVDAPAMFILVEYTPTFSVRDVVLEGSITEFDRARLYVLVRTRIFDEPSEIPCAGGHQTVRRDAEALECDEIHRIHR